ncbi:MAG: hypothetical protein LBN07_04410 [Christensenellaceae bacterium]|jgi:adenylate cyclase class IV|nr:hypothetical protein [Christensenellaceae bacterium]
MTEYEYSFRVKSLKPYIDYCIKNNYTLKSNNKQEGMVYRKRNKTLARVMINTMPDGNVTKKIDFKDEDFSTAVLKERRESLPLNFTDEDAIKSILEFLGYKKYKSFIRTRTVYTKSNTVFELDFYEQSKNQVIAIEGLKTEVDAVYKEIKNIENENKDSF